MPSPPVPLLFDWTNTGNYPAGANPWNGQPLAVAPIQTYFMPGTKQPAENMNYLFGQIAGDLGKLNTYLENLSTGQWAEYFTTTTGIVVPSNCFWMGFVGYGGGGGGEGGNRGEVFTSDSLFFVQGGGGAGAPLVTAGFPTNPGDTLSVTVGAAGTGGATNGGAGGDGGATIVQCTAGVYAGTTYVNAPGGAGAGCGSENWSGGSIVSAWNSAWQTTYSCGGIPITLLPSAPPFNADTFYAPGSGILVSLGVITLGGAGIATGLTRPFPFSTGPLPLITGVSGADLRRFDSREPGRGGLVAAYYNVAAPSVLTRIAGNGARGVGWMSNADGGAGGAIGTDSPAGSGFYYLGGCGGGGGGGGPGGEGGQGGQGGDANNGGTAFPAGASTSPTNGNSGAGGGGGGGGGQGSSGNGAPSAGSAGAAGYSLLFWMSGPPTYP
jgi:hypothetical protein